MFIFILHQCYLTNHSATLAILCQGHLGIFFPASGPASPPSRCIIRSLWKLLLESHPLGPMVITATGMTPSRRCGNSESGPPEA